MRLTYFVEESVARHFMDFLKSYGAPEDIVIEPEETEGTITKIWWVCADVEEGGGEYTALFHMLKTYKEGIYAGLNVAMTANPETIQKLYTELKYNE